MNKIPLVLVQQKGKSMIEVEKEIKPSEQCKMVGLKSLAQAVELSGFPRQTLRDMCLKHPYKFQTVLLGSVARLQIIESDVSKPPII